MLASACRFFHVHPLPGSSVLNRFVNLRRMAASALALAALGSPGWAASKAPVWPAPACDVMADDPTDPNRVAPGVELHLLDGAKAAPACIADLAADPANGRLMFAYGRALQRQGQNAAALDQYRMAAERGYPIAQMIVGVMFQNGLAAPRDLPQSVVWFRKAADQGYLPAQTVLGAMYLNGLGVEKDPAQAVAWYRKAADHSDPMAQSNLSALYHNGVGVAQDHQQAFEWMRKAAEQGYAPAQTGLGGMYHAGLGVPKDDRKAMEWYAKGAEQGYAVAQSDLGLMYHNGWGVAVDEPKAAQWFEKAAEQGYQPAQTLLAAMREMEAAPQR